MRGRERSSGGRRECGVCLSGTAARVLESGGLRAAPHFARSIEVSLHRMLLCSLREAPDKQTPHSRLRDSGGPCRRDIGPFGVRGRDLGIGTGLGVMATRTGRPFGGATGFDKAMSLERTMGVLEGCDD